MSTAVATAAPARRLPGLLLLRRALEIDAAASMTSGVALMAAASAISDALGLSATFLGAMGAAFLAYGLAVLYVATRPAIPRRAAWTIVALNALSFVDFLATMELDLFSPTAWGTAFFAANAAFVAVISGAQFLGLRRSR